MRSCKKPVGGCSQPGVRTGITGKPGFPVCRTSASSRSYCCVLPSPCGPTRIATARARLIASSSAGTQRRPGRGSLRSKKVVNPAQPAVQLRGGVDVAAGVADEDIVGAAVRHRRTLCGRAGRSILRMRFQTKRRLGRIVMPALLSANLKPCGVPPPTTLRAVPLPASLTLHGGGEASAAFLPRASAWTHTSRMPVAHPLLRRRPGKVSPKATDGVGRGFDAKRTAHAAPRPEGGGDLLSTPHPSGFARHLPSKAGEGGASPRNVCIPWGASAGRGHAKHGGGEAAEGRA